MRNEEHRRPAEKIYISRNSRTGRFTEVKTTKGGRTLIKSPVKSEKTKASSWKRAFKK